MASADLKPGGWIGHTSRSSAAEELFHHNRLFLAECGLDPERHRDMDALANDRQDQPCIPIDVGSVAPDKPPEDRGSSREDRALLSLGRALRDRGYRFTTITPLSHRRVNARVPKGSPSLEDVFGWSRPFRERDIPEDILRWLREADAIETTASGFHSNVRFSSLGDQLFAHSAFPTDQSDAVFFGPDTYRFVRAIGHLIAETRPNPPRRIVDIGAGSGAGGLHAAQLLAKVSPTVVLSDINRRALRFSRINAALNSVPKVQTIESDLFARLGGGFDLIISNPPYLVDPLARLYRHGGGDLGSALSLDIVTQGVERLAPGGRLLLYTGSAIVAGEDVFHASLRKCLATRGLRWAYEEIDPDVFGEELDHPPYDRADRIAAVAVTIELA